MIGSLTENTQAHFREKQRKIIEAASKERKEAEKLRIVQANREYYNDLDWQRDRLYDGSDEQPYEEE